MIIVSLPFDNTSVAYYKHDERGRAEMCKEVEEYAKDYAKEYAEEYAEQKKKEYRDEMIINIIKKKRCQNTSDEEIKAFIIEAYDLSEEEADAYMKSIQK